MPSALRTYLLEAIGRACCLTPTGGYSKPTIHIKTGDQEVDHFDMDESSASIVLEKNRQEWRSLAAMLNRAALGIYLAASLIVLIWYFSKFG